ncbi:MAG: hypothetical protein ACOYXB_09765 [Bacteroidota bacterium]
MKKLFSGLFNLLAYPSHSGIIIRDLLKIKYKKQDDRIHLDETMNWLVNAQDHAAGGGVAGVYTFAERWTEPYPETTGYIIPTFLNYAELTGDHSYIERAKRMADWELSIQLASGAVRGGVGVNEYPIVFNTGQVILGWTSIYKNTGEQKYLDASVKAASWLVSIQDEDGKWLKHTFNNTPHAYNVRVTWSVLKVYHLTGDRKFLDAAVKNIQWVLENGQENGWFRWMGFKADEVPLTHTIAYTLRGLLESSFLLEGELKDTIQATVIKASRHIIGYYDQVKKENRLFSLPGNLDENWKSDFSYSCLTGDAQMAIIWLKLYRLTGDEDYFKAAERILDDLKTVHNLKSRNKGIRGGIAGSYPIWGKYVNFGYPNWAAKFFADALMLKGSVKN